jgi:hypothetical protein
LPADAKVVGFTDWAKIRRHMGLGSASTAAARASLNTDASSRDLSTRSVIGGAVEDMHVSYGWSAADVDWEAYGQAQDGAAMVARLDDSVSLDDVKSRLRELGYSRDGRVWTASGATLDAVGSELGSTLGSVAIVPDQRLVVAADRSTYVSSVLDVIQRDQPSLLSVRPAAGVASALAGADAALLQSDRFVCEPTGLQDQDATVQSQGRAAVERAGGLETPTYSGRAIFDDSRTTQTVIFAMTFGSPQVASEQLRVRTALSSGPFIGRSGRIEDSLDLVHKQVDESTVALLFDHDPETTVYMTGDGPLLFAGCDD